MCADWNELFFDPAKVIRTPDPLVEEFLLENKLGGRVLDLGCVAGRHLVFLACRGYQLCGTDVSPQGLQLTAAWLHAENLTADLLLAPMFPLPFSANAFAAAISINVLNHATLGHTIMAAQEVYRVLKPGAPFFFVIIGRGDARCGEGEEIEPFTYIPRQGIETGVPHHYYDLEEIEQLTQPFQRKTFTERRRPYDDADTVFGHDPRLQKMPDAQFHHWVVRAWK